MSKFLLAEDNEDHAEIIMLALSTGGSKHNIFWVKDGEEALDFIYHRKRYEDKTRFPSPDYLLLDINMPKIDGFEVLNTLKNDPAYKEIPIIMLTTSDYKEDIKRSYQLGANSFVTKSASNGNFMDSVTNIEIYWTKTNLTVNQPR